MGHDRTRTGAPQTIDIPLGHRRRVSRLVLLGVTVVALALAGLVYLKLRATFSCTPPTEQEKAVIERFVRAHVDSPSAMQWTVLDCDDRGEAHLTFSAVQPAQELRLSFLGDPACKSDQQPDSGGEAISCEVARRNAYVFLEQAEKQTDAEVVV